MLDGLKTAREIINTEIQCRMKKEANLSFTTTGLVIALRLIDEEVKVAEDKQ